MDLFFVPLSIKRIIYLILVALTAFFIAHGWNISQSNWVILSALMMSLITVGDSFKQRIISIVITGLLIAFVTFIVGVSNEFIIGLLLILFIVTCKCVYIGQIYPRYYYLVFIINLFAILATTRHLTLYENTARFRAICFGVSIALVYQLIFYPYFIRNEFKAYLIIALNRLKKLNHEIFACMLEQEYSDNLYLYERRIHNQKHDFLQVMTRLREIYHLAAIKMTEKEKTIHETWLNKINLLFDNMMDYSQIRRRVTDYTTFSVCSIELKQISQEINRAIETLMLRAKNKKLFQTTHVLAQKINRLDENYHHVLQVAAREPLVFLLMIDSLKMFKQTLDELDEIPLPFSASFS